MDRWDDSAQAVDQLGERFCRVTERNEFILDLLKDSGALLVGAVENVMVLDGPDIFPHRSEGIEGQEDGLPPRGSETPVVVADDVTRSGASRRGQNPSGRWIS